MIQETASSETDYRAIPKRQDPSARLRTGWRLVGRVGLDRGPPGEPGLSVTLRVVADGLPGESLDPVRCIDPGGGQEVHKVSHLVAGTRKTR